MGERDGHLTEFADRLILSQGEVERHADSGAVFPPLTPIWSVVFLYV